MKEEFRQHKTPAYTEEKMKELFSGFHVSQTHAFLQPVLTLCESGYGGFSSRNLSVELWPHFIVTHLRL